MFHVQPKPRRRCNIAECLCLVKLCDHSFLQPCCHSVLLYIYIYICAMSYAPRFCIVVLGGFKTHVKSFIPWCRIEGAPNPPVQDQPGGSMGYARKEGSSFTPGQRCSDCHEGLVSIASLINGSHSCDMKILSPKPSLSVRCVALAAQRPLCNAAASTTLLGKLLVAP